MHKHIKRCNFVGKLTLSNIKLLLSVRFIEGRLLGGWLKYFRSLCRRGALAAHGLLITALFEHDKSKL